MKKPFYKYKQDVLSEWRITHAGFENRRETAEVCEVCSLCQENTLTCKVQHRKTRPAQVQCRWKHASKTGNIACRDNRHHSVCACVGPLHINLSRVELSRRVLPGRYLNVNHTSTYVWKLGRVSSWRDSQEEEEWTNEWTNEIPPMPTKEQERKS